MTVYNRFRAVLESGDAACQDVAACVIRDHGPLDTLFEEIILGDYPQEMRIYTLTKMLERLLRHDFVSMEILEKAIDGQRGVKRKAVTSIN